MELGAGALCQCPRGRLAISRGDATVVWPPTWYFHPGDLHINELQSLRVLTQTTAWKTLVSRTTDRHTDWELYHLIILCTVSMARWTCQCYHQYTVTRIQVTFNWYLWDSWSRVKGSLYRPRLWWIFSRCLSRSFLLTKSSSSNSTLFWKTPGPSIGK